MLYCPNVAVINSFSVSKKLEDLKTWTWGLARALLDFSLFFVACERLLFHGRCCVFLVSLDADGFIVEIEGKQFHISIPSETHLKIQRGLASMAIDTFRRP